VVKPRLLYEVLKWADEAHLEVWDIRVYGTDQNGKDFETTLRFEVPVDIGVIVDNLTMFAAGVLRQLPD
jgi:hypothetical protein